MARKDNIYQQIKQIFEDAIKHETPPQHGVVPGMKYNISGNFSGFYTTGTNIMWGTGPYPTDPTEPLQPITVPDSAEYLVGYRAWRLVTQAESRRKPVPRLLPELMAEQDPFALPEIKTMMTYTYKDRLHSPSFDDGPWEPDAPHRASCNTKGLNSTAWLTYGYPGRPHGAPHPQCRCGIYGVYDVTRCQRTTAMAGVSIFGIIKAWGSVIPATDGFRAEHARLVALLPHQIATEWLKDATHRWSYSYGDDKRDAANHEIERVAQRFEVPVIPAELLHVFKPEWVLEGATRTVNQSTEGTIDLGVLQKAIIDAIPQFDVPRLDDGP